MVGPLLKDFFLVASLSEVNQNCEICFCHLLVYYKFRFVQDVRCKSTSYVSSYSETKFLYEPVCPLRFRQPVYFLDKTQKQSDLKYF